MGEKLRDKPKEHQQAVPKVTKLVKDADALAMLHFQQIRLLVHVCNFEWSTDVILLILCKRKNVWLKFNL